ncbi:hypothetical protein M501DRAFT_966802 [Patellaria atrata CBS 101060]|uniref:Dol-P-Man:Man(5)GlcNAc(2)-PP-Dol alpha-1,3-mannosyltransferase n=1 Tax=Patellaria atrata CBS 101060 TaxID=1346257 RepID=A0A9P4SI56_9PEZI|nr:hypothetical protein M501DRAFT_966802 [Patellaria atrata CBS 101060]
MTEGQPKPPIAMSKISPALKALINAPAARPNPTPAPPNIRAVYERIAREAASKNVGQPSWVAMSTAATMTLNSPASLSTLFVLAAPETQSHPQRTHTAELIREVGLKCISFNGIPRTINMLAAFRASLPPSVASALTAQPSRAPTSQNVEDIASRGRGLWDSIYAPFETKLVERLTDSHPDLPVHILNSHYGALLADPSDRPSGVKVGRVLASIVAVACLRAQTGVGPQVLSHVYGLRKAVEDGSWKGDEEAGAEEGVRWLAGDEGGAWLLESVDRIVDAVGGTTYAPAGARESKL